MDVAKPYRKAIASNAADFLDKVTAEMPWPVKAIQIDGGSVHGRVRASVCGKGHSPLCLAATIAEAQRRRRTMQRRLATNSTPSSTCKATSPKSLITSTPSSISTTTSGRTALLTAKPQTNIFKSAETGMPLRLMCNEPGQPVDAARAIG